jgi:HPt (histidine-containing phosphotransfer) domain-containing protein
MPHVPVELDEGAGIEQPLDSLAGEQLAALALSLDGALGACVLRLLVQLAQPFELLLRRLVDAPFGVGHRRGA